MMSLEEIVALFSLVQPSQGNLWEVKNLIPRRLHLGRGAGGEYAVFIEGTLDSFGYLLNRPGIQFDDSNIELQPTQRTFPALRLIGKKDAVTQRPMAHVAYEMSRQLQLNPLMTNEELLREVDWILDLLDEKRTGLTVESQLGLAGELRLLRRLIMKGKELNIRPGIALERWKSPQRGRRDFASEGIAIEAKATRRNTRSHYITSLEQLEPSVAKEKVFIFSIGLKTDASGPRKLTDFVREVEALLVNDSGDEDRREQARFRELIGESGYLSQDEPIYSTGIGFQFNSNLPEKLFAVGDLDPLRITSFKNDRLPSMVTSVSYEMEITADPLSSSEETEVLRKLLLGAQI